MRMIMTEARPAKSLKISSLGTQQNRESMGLSVISRCPLENRGLGLERQ